MTDRGTRDRREPAIGPLPRPPWRPPPAPVARRAQISQDRIVEAALAIIDAEGTEAVTMRRIAAELGTGPASLYVYVSGKDDVLTLAHERAMGEFVLPDTADLSWDQAVRRWAAQLAELYRRHQDLARLNFADIPTGPKALAVTDRLLGLMIEGGMPAGIASWLIDRLALYIAGDVFEGWLLARRFASTDPSDRRSPQDRGIEWIAAVREFYTTLPADQFPYLVGNLDVMMSGDGDDRFAFGLDLMLAGAAALAGLPIPPPQARPALAAGRGDVLRSGTSRPSPAADRPRRRGRPSKPRPA